MNVRVLLSLTLHRAVSDDVALKLKLAVSYASSLRETL